ncbi:unnamed protein product [Hydatigera taeniaeformis]|uniref:Lamin n=1 Tax=Hydatigena taeniaeformis TaxID=6205 RepID=A0A0R3X3R8_HYDTA|nr:unnamed protein product [Hydatigera taeniaeformis]
MSARSKKSKQLQATSEKVSTPKKADHSRATSSTGTSASECTEHRSSSPLAISRVDEKEELAHLNDRLASYIDYVRKLERDKECLTRRISTISEERLSQVDEARKTYEKEIASLRRLVDDLAKEKAAKEVELKKHIDDMNDAKAKLCKRDAEVRSLQLKVDTLERDVAMYKQDYDRYQQLRPEYDEVEKKLEATRKGLEAETVLRTDLENKVASLREELDFKDRLFQEERSKLVMRTLTVEEEVEDRKAAEFESRLADELQAYRQQTNDELQQYRIQMETTFQTKLEQLQQANAEANKDSGRLNDELLVMRRRCDDLCHELAKKTREVDLLQNRVHDLESLLNKAHDDYQAQLAAERDEIKRLKAELEQRFAEFTDLMNTKIALDQEILMYRKMLEGEESRLNLTSPKRTSPFSGTYMGVKRRRLDSGDELDDDSSSCGSQFAFRVSTSAVGDIEFTADQDGSGKWIKLINVAKQDINIGNWALKHQADGEEVVYKFGRAFSLKPGATCTVWSSDSGVTPNPPETVVMKNQVFHSGANITITLISEDEKASFSRYLHGLCLAAFPHIQMPSFARSMSARSKRSQQGSESTITTARRTTSVTVPSSAPSGDRRRQRSVSPLNISRNEEKEELAELNDRLASYIDYVRKLEMDKEHLKRKIKTYSEERLSKHDDARNTYEAEIASLRRLVDDLAKQKAVAEVEAEKHKDDAKTAQSKLGKRESEVRGLQRRVEGLERDLTAYKQDHDRYEALKPDYDALEKRCTALRRDLDAETVLRNDLENKLAGLREELNFKNRLLEEERLKAVERTITVESEIEDRKAAEYESKLYDQLQAYRDQTAEDLLAYKTEMEHTFENKLNQLRAANSDASKETDRLRDELLVVRKRSDDLEHELGKKVAEVDLLKRRVDELERMRRHERDDYEKRLALQREELARLQRELEIHFAEFADLMNTKVALDQEILMYRKMLEGEETRLNIPVSGPREGPVAAGAKRRRPLNVDYDEEEGEEEDEGIHSTSTSSLGSSMPRVTYRVATNSNGNIEFAPDQNEMGKCVKIVNSSDEACQNGLGTETNIGNWVLKQKADSHEVTFKFPRSLILQPGASCQIWNSDSGATNDPPKDLVMKNQSFKMGTNISFSLIGNDKEVRKRSEQANCQITREHVRYPRFYPRSQSSLPSEEVITTIILTTHLDLMNPFLKKSGLWTSNGVHRQFLWDDAVLLRVVMPVSVFILTQSICSVSFSHPALLVHVMWLLRLYTDLHGPIEKSGSQK